MRCHRLLIGGWLLLIAAEARAGIAVACAPERAFAAIGESVAVRAWVTDDDGERLQTQPTFRWRAQQGTIAGRERATWTLKDRVFGSRPGATTFTATASVGVEAPKYGSGTCEVTVLVALVAPATGKDDPLRSARLTARLFLLPNMTEPLDYGLRSYLIFSARPRDQTEETRYVAAVEAYLQVLVPVEDFLVQSVRASRLNVTMVPVIETVSGLPALDGISAIRDVSREVVRKYDYARARLLLEELGVGEIGGGPYLISRETLSGAASQGKLVVDMSGVSSSLIRDWMTWFCWLAGQERSWSEIAVRRLGLNLRNIIAVTGETTPVVLVSLLHPLYVLKPR